MLGLLLLLSPAAAHSVFSGHCPAFTPMQNFDWNQVRHRARTVHITKGQMFPCCSSVTACGTSRRSSPPSPPVSPTSSRRTSSGSSLLSRWAAGRMRQLTVLQVRRLPYTGAVGLDSHYVYTGKLYTPQEATPARMIVKFPLSRFQFHLIAKCQNQFYRPDWCGELHGGGGQLQQPRPGLHLPGCGPHPHRGPQALLLHPAAPAGGDPDCQVETESLPRTPTWLTFGLSWGFNH